MHLTSRPIPPADLDACWRIVQGDRFYPPALKPSRTEFWKKLLASNSALSIVVEDADRAPNARVCAFSMSVFVTDEFAAAVQTALPPCVDGHLHAQAVAGGASPILGPAAIGRANARDGLILFPGPFGYAPAKTETEQVAVAEMMFAALFREHAGYQIKELLLETSLSTRWIASNSAGMRRRTDHAAYFQAHPDLLPPPEEHPALYGLTRSEALETLGSRMLPLFLYTRPRFGFRPAEQRLLSQALSGGTNEEAAEALFISLSAVKKCWETIYARVILIEPELLGAVSGLETKRGSEKKDRLLTYLRHHPEELRPYQR
jgi:DNA-binding CsgD family transcriptional regulator